MRSFLLSRLHANGVTCTSCHEPHGARLRYEGNELCMSCHQETVNERVPPVDPASHSHHDVTGEGGQCVNCHMPITTYMVRDPRRDHGFTVPDPLLTKELGIPNACNRCHQDQEVEWAIDHVEEWYGERMERPQRRRARLVARAFKTACYIFIFGEFGYDELTFINGIPKRYMLDGHFLSTGFNFRKIKNIIHQIQ